MELLILLQDLFHISYTIFRRRRQLWTNFGTGIVIMLDRFDGMIEIG